MDISTIGSSETRPGDDTVQVRVMGTPRSGTNLAKYLVERYLKTPVVFDQGFWKHGIFPALMSGRDLQYGELPIIVVSKDPVTQIPHGTAMPGTILFSSRANVSGLF
ncbi:hypothetical protein [Mesorhizobium amorphae]|uniref:Sulfotransferase domain-containing protein n=1 Tax=Mesorhizobium amorphae CCNWGS0123 TaxID=1082933 RepID=G6YEA5_9HYPH|nr:hypothetical protein [Mesorhizobium amorphae]ANT49589.1 hypothetical protein A6B35_06340 [Mesorhizobium amorphae CCNWGS0123]EHH09919.1 hypothetical protein MEA186_21489 [Mesorhizobium amorphae CCNWGS0123]